MLRKLLYGHFLLLLIIAGQYSKGQESSTDTLYHKFRADVLMELEANNGRVVWDNETKESYLLLMAARSIDTLVKYTDDSIPAVRAKIFAGLVEKHAATKKLKEVLDKHAGDTATFVNASTDVVMCWTVKGYMQLAMDYGNSNKVAKAGYKARLESVRNNNRFRVIVPGARHGLILKDSLLALDSLVYSERGFRILSFSLAIGDEMMTSKNVFTQSMKAFIKKMQPGEPVFIEEIVVQGPDKTTRKVLPVFLKIKS